MEWLKPKDYRNQKYMELRLHAPKSEKILLDFNPLRMSDEPDWNPQWEEWHCYPTPLRVYQQDYNLLIGYFKRIYPINDAFDGTVCDYFDCCFDNWIGTSDWLLIITEIEKEINTFSHDEKCFLEKFLSWLNEALKHTSIIVVEGNL